MANKLSVSQLNNYIKGVFDDELVLQKIYLYGEVYEFSQSNGFTYITLKEGECYIHCVKYSLLEKVEIGSMITLFGSVTFYRKTGRVTFSILSMQKTGEGQIYAEFLKLKESLKKQGLFENKLKLPNFVRSVGIITSSTGAVIHDFISVLKSSHSYVDVQLFQSKVQGENADIEICNALKEAEQKGFDVLVVARGGGSGADLECFNSEIVVRTIHDLSTPTISAIGHETDYSLCDLASTVRAGTPSIAAGIIANVNDAMISKFNTICQEIVRVSNKKINDILAKLMLSTAKLSQASQNINEYYSKICERFIYNGVEILKRKINNKEIALRNVLNNVNDVFENKLLKYENKLNLSLTALDLQNPAKLLSNGYAKVIKDGKTISKAKELNTNDEFDLYFVDGKKKGKILEN